ncbi:universal stress protein [Lentzea sp. NBRC 105346]|uniref:universal stress protein n=1 Tax=Lentzea sp. NBRC 105346 TaxID=3032205 RepID=UPI0024A585F6|nr:universal stress protein [Lentzea sp. NBRC 105346]GLZ27814.1 universal stress protein [Lentzea sp. NBRC 105346]
MSDNESRPIVVGVDGSPAGQAALRWAVDEARRRNCPVDAVSAWHRDYGMVIGPLPAEVGMELSPERMREGQQAVLDEATRGFDGVRLVLVEGDPRTVLTEASENAELLVVGNRGHSPFVEAILGSVSAHCVHHAACPVVVIRAVETEAEREAPEPLTPGPLL